MCDIRESLWTVAESSFDGFTLYLVQVSTWAVEREEGLHVLVT